jgi:hypothetical protein
LCIHDRNMSFAESIRSVAPSERNRSVLEGHNFDPVARGGRVQIVNLGSQGRGNRTSSNVTCFYCKKVGHVRRDCWKRQRNTAATGTVARSEELVPVWWFHGEFWLTLLLICRKWKYNLGHYMPPRSSTLVR